MVQCSLVICRMLPLPVRMPLSDDSTTKWIVLIKKPRRVATCFALSTHWKSYDVFAVQKMSTFRSSRPAVIELAGRYHELITQMKSKSHNSSSEADEAEKILFMEICEICLWGNATDLSLLTTLTYEDIQKLQGSEARKASEKNILVNDLEAAYAVLKKAQKEGKTERRVDIVLDNAGFELYVDLILAGFLISAGLATNVVLHPKSIPWFVSDVLPGDFAALLNALANPQSFYTTPSEDEKATGTTPEPLKEKEQEELEFLFDEWSGMHAEGQLTIRPNDFWTEGGSFWRLPGTAKELYEDLKESELVVFKGDLNYRKLVADVCTLLSLPFQTSIPHISSSSNEVVSHLGYVGSNYTFHRRHWSHGTWFGDQSTVATNLQGGRCGGIEGRFRRGVESDGGRRW